MMVRLSGDRDRLFYEFDLDEMVPADHLVRRIDGVLDLGWLHGELASVYSHTGRPSIDPELMIRMLIIGYVFAIRSERQLCAEVQVNLAYRWFCRLSIEDKVPNHSAFSRARHERFGEGDVFRRVFEWVVAGAIAAGLVGGGAFSLDACFIKADVSPSKRVPGDKPIGWPDRERGSRAVAEYLGILDRGSDAESTRDCASCALKPRCTSGPARKVSRDIDEPIRDHVRALAKTEAFETSRREPKKVEMAFAHLKRILKLDRLRLRGLSGARDEILLAATAQNLRKMAKYARRAPPGSRTYCLV